MGSVGEALGERCSRGVPTGSKWGPAETSPPPPAVQPCPAGRRARGGRGSAAEQDSDGQPRLPGRLNAWFQSTPVDPPGTNYSLCNPTVRPVIRGGLQHFREVEGFLILSKRVTAEGRRAT